MKKLLALLVAMMLVLGCCAFAEQDYNPDAMLFTTCDSDPTHLDPALCSDGQSTCITGSLYSALIGYNRDGSLYGDVAESWDVSEDGIVYTFHIRDGIKFHDGTPCNAQAIEWNWNRVIPANATADMTYSSVLYDCVESFKAIDDLTFEVTLKSSNSTFLTLQGSNSLAAGLVSPTAYEADPEGFDRNPVGCGPYKFVEWVPGDHIILERYDEYHLGEVCNAGIYHRIIPEAATQVSELLVGGVDVLNSVSSDQMEMVESQAQLLTVPGTNLSIMSFADFDKNPIFSDIRMRQAVCYALDMDSINKALFGDRMESAFSAIPVAMQSGSWDGYSAIGYDPEKAKELMAEAGYPEGFECTLLTYNVTKGYNPAGEQLAVQIQAELAKVGITVNLIIMPWAEFSEKMYADPVEGYDILLHGWGADYNDTSNILYLWGEGEIGGGLNHSGYTDPEFNEYLNGAMTAASYDEAGELYAKAAQKLNDDVPSYILGHAFDYYGASRAIVNAEEGIGGWGNMAHFWMLKKAA